MKKADLYRHMHPISLLDRLKPSMLIMLFPVIQQIILHPENIIIITASLSLDVLYALMLMIYSFTAYRSRFYRIRNDSIVMKKGILFRHHYLLPLKNIQTIILYESFLLSIFGAVRIFFDTSGGGISRSDMKLCIGRKTALAVKKLISAQKTFVCRSKGFYIILMSIIWANPLSGFLWLLPVINEIGKLYGFSARQAYDSVDFPLLQYLPFIDPAARTLITLLLIGWAGSFIIQLLRYAAFECSREGKRIVITRGILGKTTVYSNLQGISAWIAESTLLMNFLGLQSCSVCTVGIGKMKGDKSLLLPAAAKSQTKKQLAKLCGEPLPEQINIHPPKKGIARYIAMPLMILIFSTIITFFLSAQWTILSGLKSLYFVIAVGSIWWCLMRIYAFRCAGIGTDKHYVCATVFKGLRIKTYYIPKEKLSYWCLSQSLLQRQSGLCNLSLYISYETKMKITVYQLSLAEVTALLHPIQQS